GDPSIFMGLYDEEAETQRVAQALENNEAPEAFEATLNAEDDGLDWLDSLMGGGEQSSASPAETRTPLSLFRSDFDYARHGLEYLHEHDRLANQPRADERHQTIELQPDDDLDRFLKQQLSPEMRPTDHVYALSANTEVVKNAIKSARDGDAWPAIHHLWALHPMLQCLDFKLLSLVGRQRAPVIRLPRGIAAGESLVLISALIPNRRGQPVLNDWFAVRVGSNGKILGDLSFEELINTTGLGHDEFPNAGKPFDAKTLQALLPPALDYAGLRMVETQKQFSAMMRERAAEELARLDKLRGQHHQQLELDFRAGGDFPLARSIPHKQAQRAREIDVQFDEYKRWVSLTLELDSRAHMAVAAVLIS
ncbi:MAG: hypothetical protein K8H75_17830, partial [Sulfuricella sp.]|nr:hypothetical protein [Sulfuricella sp.]